MRFRNQTSLKKTNKKKGYINYRAFLNNSSGLDNFFLGTNFNKSIIEYLFSFSKTSEPNQFFY